MPLSALTTLALCFAQIHAQPALSERALSEPALVAEKLYHGIGRPIMISVQPQRTVGNFALAMMDHEGKLLTDPASVRPGRIDLAGTLPAVWTLRKAAYLQLMDGTEPLGPSLVLQPMLTRWVPVTIEARRPDGSPYTRISGWREENQPPPPSQPTSNPPGQPPGEPPPAATDATNAADPASSQDLPPPADTRVLTGFRIYPEQDVVLQTDQGDLVVALRPDEAPNTAWNFARLAEGGFYDGVVFHRIVPLDRQGRPFVIQAGDPGASGDGGPGYWLPMEWSTLPHDFGVISMARADDPDSAGSQFFFGLSREGTARLDGQYCSFGYAIRGGDVIRSIAQVELADVSAGKPVKPPVIRRCELVDAPPRQPGRGRPDQRVSSQPVQVQPGDHPRHVPR
jgi:peptidyl-prolyl cis-trans isomerase B (cyclophilin B)